MNLITLDCKQCGASLDMDPDKLMTYCPHCGTKMMIEVDDLQQLLLSKEQTKRDEMKYTHERELKQLEVEDNNSSKKIVMKVVLAFIIVFFVMIIFSEISSYLFFHS